jgi:osmotically-inducible protein OsmY
MSRSTPSAGATVKSDTSVKASKSSPDAMITGKIKSGFIKDKIVRSRNYNVDTHDGVVTVKGKARSQAEADRAIEIAKGTEGVSSVKNEVQVMASSSSSKTKSSKTAANEVEPRNSTAPSEKPKERSASATGKSSSSTGTSASSSSPDALITTKVKAEYAKDKLVSATKIHVDTNNGVVNLSGMAKSQAEADKAVALAKNVKGVTSVKSDIKVEGK